MNTPNVGAISVALVTEAITSDADLNRIADLAYDLMIDKTPREMIAVSCLLAATLAQFATVVTNVDEVLQGMGLEFASQD